MSTYSLPRLINGGGLSKNKVVNYKYASLNRYPTNGIGDSGPAINCNGNAMKTELLLSKRRTLNRNGSIVHNQFRGIKKQMLESQTNLIIHSMTVSVAMPNSHD